MTTLQANVLIKQNLSDYTGLGHDLVESLSGLDQQYSLRIGKSRCGLVDAVLTVLGAGPLKLPRGSMWRQAQPLNELNLETLASGLDTLSDTDDKYLLTVTGPDPKRKMPKELLRLLKALSLSAHFACIGTTSHPMGEFSKVQLLLEASDTDQLNTLRTHLLKWCGKRHQHVSLVAFGSYFSDRPLHLADLQPLSGGMGARELRTYEAIVDNTAGLAWRALLLSERLNGEVVGMSTLGEGDLTLLRIDVLAHRREHEDLATLLPGDMSASIEPTLMLLEDPELGLGTHVLELIGPPGVLRDLLRLGASTTSNFTTLKAGLMERFIDGESIADAPPVMLIRAIVNNTSIAAAADLIERFEELKADNGAFGSIVPLDDLDGARLLKGQTDLPPSPDSLAAEASPDNQRTGRPLPAGA